MSQEMADLFQRITTGVYVIGVAAGKRQNAFTAAWVMPVSFRPLLLSLSINPHHSSYQLLKDGGGFSVNVLRKDDLALAAHFGQPASLDKLAPVAWRPGKSGAPLLDNALARFECRFAGESEAGDHRLVLGQVVNGVLLQAEAEPLSYRDTGSMDGAAVIYPDGFD